LTSILSGVMLHYKDGNNLQSDKPKKRLFFIEMIF